MARPVFRTKDQKRNGWHGDRCEILNSWNGQEGKIGSVHDHRYFVPLTEGANMTRRDAWTVIALEGHLIQETLG